jgi:hypothetical protein
VPNVYLLVDLSRQKAQRQNQLLAAAPATPGLRELPHQIGHIRESIDGSSCLFQAELTDQELATLLSNPWITQIGTYDPVTAMASQSVFDELAKNPTLWNRPTPPGGGS